MEVRALLSDCQNNMGLHSNDRTFCFLLYALSDDGGPCGGDQEYQDQGWQQV